MNSWQLAVLAFYNSSPHATPTVQVSTTPAPTGFTSANNGTLNGYTSGGLGGRVPFLPINSLDVGNQSKIDARLSKLFPITERMKAMFTFDAFNVFNHRFFTAVNNRMYVYRPSAGRTDADLPVERRGRRRHRRASRTAQMPGGCRSARD